MTTIETIAPSLVQNTTTPTQEAHEAHEAPDFGRGRYGSLSREMFKDAQVILGLTATRAEKLTRRVVSDYGAIMARSDVSYTDIKFGKLRKDATYSSIKEAAAVIKDVQSTNSLFILQGLAWAAQAGKFGFKHSHTKWALNDLMLECIANLNLTGE